MKLLSINEVAERLGVSSRTVRRLLDDRQLPFYVVATRRKVNDEDVTAYLGSRRVDASSGESGQRTRTLDGRHIDYLRATLTPADD